MNMTKARFGNLSWSKTQAPYGSLSASIDAETGNILNLYIYKGYDPDRKTSPIPKYNEEEARKIAEGFAKNYSPKNLQGQNFSSVICRFILWMAPLTGIAIPLILHARKTTYP